MFHTLLMLFCLYRLSRMPFLWMLTGKRVSRGTRVQHHNKIVHKCHSWVTGTSASSYTQKCITKLYLFVIYLLAVFIGMHTGCAVCDLAQHNVSKIVHLHFNSIACFTILVLKLWIVVSSQVSVSLICFMTKIVIHD